MGLTEVAPGSSGALSPSRRAEKDLGVGWTEGLGFTYSLHSSSFFWLTSFMVRIL